MPKKKHFRKVDCKNFRLVFFGRGLGDGTAEVSCWVRRRMTQYLLLDVARAVKDGFCLFVGSFTRCAHNRLTNGRPEGVNTVQ